MSNRQSTPQEIATLLAWISDVTVFWGHLPHAPNDAIMIKTTPGIGPLRTHEGGRSEQLKFQVMVRGTDYDTAYSIARDAWDSLDRVNVALGTSFYQRITPADSIMDLGLDDQTPPRRLFTFNCEAIRSQL